MEIPLKNRKWRVLSSEYLLREGDWCTVRRDKVELPEAVSILTDKHYLTCLCHGYNIRPIRKFVDIPMWNNRSIGQLYLISAHCTPIAFS